MRGEPRVIARKARLSVVVLDALPECEPVRRGKCGSAVGYVLVRARSLSSGFGFAGVGVPSVEAGIAASVLALGALIASDVRPRAAPRLALAVAAVGLFALLHGHAHGTGLPQAADPARYMAGFALATLVLHGAGIGLGVAMATRRERSVRLAGAGIAAAGVVLVLGQV